MVFSFASHGCLGLINTLCRCAFWDSACSSAGPGTSGYSDGAAGGFVGAGAGRRRHPGDHSHSSSSAVGVRGLSAFAGVLFPSVVGIRRRPPPAMARSQDPAAPARSTRLQGTEALATVRELSPRLRLGKPQDCHVPLVCDVKENWEETGLFATWPVTNVLLCPECACPALTGGQSGREIRAKNMLCTGQALRS